MKLRFTLLLIVPLILFAADGNKKPQKRAASQPASAAAPASKSQIPVGAVPMGGSSWRYTDPQGKVWIYRQTPFGVMRVAENQKAASAEEVAPTADWKATEENGEVRFERSSPFGVVRWTRPKDQLSDAERRVWERDCVKKEPAPAATAPKE
jgi:hypothetical protein